MGKIYYAGVPDRYAIDLALNPGTSRYWLCVLGQANHFSLPKFPHLKNEVVVRVRWNAVCVSGKSNKNSEEELSQP